jgi:hypothetical protein
LGSELTLAGSLIATVIGVITAIAAYLAGRRYYGGPWKSAVVWLTWGVSIFTVRTILMFADEFFNPAVEDIPVWIKYPPVILGFLCLLNVAIAMRQMADFYSEKGYRKMEKEMLKFRRK